MPLAELIRDRYLSEASSKNEAAAEDFARIAELSGWSVTPEFRCYLGKKPHQGFYLAPYLRYARYAFNWNYTFLDQDIPRPADVTGSLSVVGGGLMVGHQWHFDKLVLDWWILGVGYNHNTINLAAKADLNDLNPKQYKELERYVEDVSVNGQPQCFCSPRGRPREGQYSDAWCAHGLCIGLRF